MTTFIIDCPTCKAKVAAEQSGIAEVHTNEYEPEGHRIVVGKCPNCQNLLAGVSYQVGFDGYNSDEDEWTSVTRVYPQPSKSFRSHTVPQSVLLSLADGEKSFMAGAYYAASVMYGRAMEGVCHDKLPAPAKGKHLMLGEGIDGLKKAGIIDERLFEWSKQLQGFRNSAAHSSDEVITRDDAEDLQTFVYAIVEYIYDLADRYLEFQSRREMQKRKKEKGKLPNPI